MSKLRDDLAAALNDGGPAYPHLHEGCQQVNKTEHWPGISILDWFAGQALVGNLASAEKELGGFPSAQSLAGACYEAASAMLRERERLRLEAASGKEPR